MTRKLRSFFAHYKGLPHQLAAVDALEDALPPELLADDAEWIQTYRDASQSTGANPPPPTGTVIDALAPLLDIIGKGEGTYTSVNRGRAGDTPGGWVGLDRLTLGQVVAAQAAGHVFAVGRYQFIPETLKMAARRIGMKDSEPFSAENQDRLAAALILGGKRVKLAGYLRGDGTSIIAAQTDLALEWASIPGPDGRGAYDGDNAGNLATAKSSAVRKALAAASVALNGRGIDDIPTTEEGKPASLIYTPEPQYYTQRDNGAEADRTCFSSSCAMLVKHLRPNVLRGHNADMDYLKVVQKFGDTTDGMAQVKALAQLGIKARLAKNGNFALIEEQIQRWGALCLGFVHNGTVNKPMGGGHWLFCYGYTATHIVVHDPGGEGDLLGGGFVPGGSGRAQPYSRRNFGKRWMVDGPPWRHTPDHGWAIVVDSVA